LGQYNHRSLFYKENNMKTLFYATMSVAGFVLAGWSHGAFAEDTDAKTKRVCHNEAQGSKTVSVCKTIRVHKKLEGTLVPPVKK
jgi:hypothetical protein